VWPKVDRGARLIAQLEMSRDEVGVKVGEDDVGDAKPVLLRGREVLIDVALRIDDRCRARLLVAD
jgi:hypothetical protein